MSKENNDQEVTSTEAKIKRLQSLWWLSDAPLFIDERLVERFFDAIVRPEYEQGPEAVTEKETKIKSLNADVTAKVTGEVGLPSWLLLPLKFGGEFGTKVSGGSGSENTHEVVTNRIPIWNAERQLEALTRYYISQRDDRVIFLDLSKEVAIDAAEGKKWPEDLSSDPDKKEVCMTPRPLVFIDIPPGTKIIPTVAELGDGKVELFYKSLDAETSGESGGAIGKYPGDDSFGQDISNEVKEKRRDYWRSFVKISSKQTMVAVEKATTKHGKIEWIDFRVPVNSEGDTIHLHVVPAGSANGGVFGYNFIRRGFKHGIRIVGTLKSGSDINVLAIYEK